MNYSGIDTGGWVWNIGNCVAFVDEESVEFEDDESRIVARIELDDLERLVNDARQYLNQPSLADEIVKLRDALGPDGEYEICRRDGGNMRLSESSDLALLILTIDECLRRIGRLE